MLKKTGVSSVCTAVAILLGAPTAQAQVLAHYDLSSQSLAVSPRAVGSRTSTNVLFDPPLVEGLRAPPLNADVRLDEAFAQLLSGSGHHSRPGSMSGLNWLPNPANTGPNDGIADFVLAKNV